MLRTSYGISNGLHYFLGSDSSRWVTHVRRFGSVRAEQVFDGVDAVYYLDGGRPRYDLVVASGADPSVIRMAFDGADSIAVASDGSLRILTGVGELRQQGLYAYQQVGGERRQVACRFTQDGNGGVRFALGTYDRTRALVIDPLVWSTYLGGNDVDGGVDIVLDRGGNPYVTGFTESTDYPTSVGAYDDSYDPPYTNAFVTKLSSDGSTLMYSTYLGGSHNGSQAYCIAVDDSGYAYITGVTNGSDFPTTNGAFDRSFGGVFDAFVTKLSRDGSALVYSTLLGAGGDDDGLGIALNDSGNAFVTGQTGSSGFPTTTGAYSETYQNSVDIFVSKLSRDGSSLEYSTFINSNTVATASAIAVDDTGNAYITGSTVGSDYPTTVGAYDRSFEANGLNTIVTKLNADGSKLVYSTFLSDRGSGKGYAVAVDHFGSAYVVRSAATNNWLTKLSPDGGSLVYDADAGGHSQDAIDVAVDSWGDAYVVSSTTNPAFPITPGAMDTTYNGGTDIVMMKFDQSGAARVYSTFIGGTDRDVGLGAAVNDAGFVCVLGSTYSSDYPVTNGAFDTSINPTGTGQVDMVVTTLATPTVVITSRGVAGALCSGTTVGLTWCSLLVGSVKIEYSTDAGASWITIANSVDASSGSYPWTIPAIVTTQARVRISDASNSSVIYDQTTADFEIRVLEITGQPTDQEVAVGDTASFTASQNGSAAVQWQVSNDGGNSWQSIPLATLATYSFTVALDDDGQQYRAIFSNGSCTDTTNAATLHIQPSIALTSPNGGDAFCGGSTTQITWSAFVLTAVKIELSTDAGTTWNTLANSVPNTGSYEWTVTASATGSARIRVSDVDDPAVSDVSDTNFAINVVEVTAQPADQTVTAGGTASFTAGATGSRSVQWQRSTDSGGTWTDISGATGSTYTFTAELSDDGNQYRAMFTGAPCQAMSQAATLHVQAITGVATETRTDHGLHATLTPNPVHENELTLHVNAPVGAHVSVFMHDLRGERVWEKSGVSTPSGGELVMRLDVSSLPSGSYVVIVRTDTSSTSVPVTISR